MRAGEGSPPVALACVVVDASIVIKWHVNDVENDFGIPVAAGDSA